MSLAAPQAAPTLMLDAFGRGAVASPHTNHLFWLRCSPDVSHEEATKHIMRRALCNARGHCVRGMAWMRIVEFTALLSNHGRLAG